MINRFWIYFLTALIVVVDLSFFSEIDLLGRGFFTFAWLLPLSLFAGEANFLNLIILTSLLTEVFSLFPLGWQSLGFSLLYSTYFLAGSLVRKHFAFEMLFYVFTLSGFRLVASVSHPLSILTAPKIILTALVSLPFYLSLRLLFVPVLKRCFTPSYFQLQLYLGGEKRV